MMAKLCVNPSFSALILMLALVSFNIAGPSAQPLTWRLSLVSTVTSVSISANGEFIAASNRDGMVYYISRDTGQELWRYMTGVKINKVSLSSDGEYLVAGGDSGFVYLFDKNFSGRTYLWKRYIGGAVLSLSISRSGETIVAGSFDHNLYVFCQRSSEPLWSHRLGDKVRSVEVSEDGELISAGSDDGYLYIFDKKYTRNTFISRFMTSGAIVATSISYDGRAVAAGGSDGYVYYQNIKLDKDTFTWRHRCGSKVTSVSISSQGEYVAAGDASGRVYLFDSDYSNNTCLWTYPLGGGSSLVSISRDGELLATACEKGVYLFNKDFLRRSFIWFLPTGSKITALHISADGASIVAGDEDRYIYIFWPSMVTEAFVSTRDMSSTPPMIPSTASSGTPSIVKPQDSSLAYWHIGLIVLTVASLLLLVKKKRRVSERAPPLRYSLGHKSLDKLISGGVPANYSIVLSSPPCDQKDEVIEEYLKEGLEAQETTCIYVSHSIDKISHLQENPRLFIVLCHPRADDISPTSSNIEKVKDPENLTELTIILMKVYDRVKCESEHVRVCLDVLDDILIQRRGVTTRAWLQEIIPRLKKSGIVLATVNPEMHPREDLHAILSVFDGQIDIKERRKRRVIYISRMYGIPYLREEVSL